jgi:hypothetical protein
MIAAELDGADEHDGHHRYNHGELHGGHACCLRLPALQQGSGSGSKMAARHGEFRALESSRLLAMARGMTAINCRARREAAEACMRSAPLTRLPIFNIGSSPPKSHGEQTVTRTTELALPVLAAAALSLITTPLLVQFG